MYKRNIKNKPEALRLVMSEAVGLVCAQAHYVLNTELLSQRNRGLTTSLRHLTSKAEPRHTSVFRRPHESREAELLISLV